MVKKVKIRGKWWAFVYTRLAKKWGDCDPPHAKGRMIRIHTTVRKWPKIELDTVIHECTHAAFPDLTEEAVEEFSTDLARVLWRLGYRKIL